MHKLKMIISGGQTGVDRAALNAAIRTGLRCGGWCPRGRFAEDGMISKAYPLIETPQAKYKERTDWNVRDSDGTLIVCKGKANGGTAFTLGMCSKHKKPNFILDLENTVYHCLVIEWMQIHRIMVLNVAGPRESTHPGIGLEAEANLLELFLRCSSQTKQAA